jgi:hypothetical protein
VAQQDRLVTRALPRPPGADTAGDRWTAASDARARSQAPGGAGAGGAGGAGGRDAGGQPAGATAAGATTRTGAGDGVGGGPVGDDLVDGGLVGSAGSWGRAAASLAERADQGLEPEGREHLAGGHDGSAGGPTLRSAGPGGRDRSDPGGAADPNSAEQEAVRAIAALLDPSGALDLSRLAATSPRDGGERSAPRLSIGTIEVVVTPTPPPARPVASPPAPPPRSRPGNPNGAPGSGVGSRLSLAARRCYGMAQG